MSQRDHRGGRSGRGGGRGRGQGRGRGRGDSNYTNARPGGNPIVQQQGANVPTPQQEQSFQPVPAPSQSVWGSQRNAQPTPHQVPSQSAVGQRDPPLSLQVTKPDSVDAPRVDDMSELVDCASSVQIASIAEFEVDRAASEKASSTSGDTGKKRRQRKKKGSRDPLVVQLDHQTTPSAIGVPVSGASLVGGGDISGSKLTVASVPGTSTSGRDQIAKQRSVTVQGPLSSGGNKLITSKLQIAKGGSNGRKVKVYTNHFLMDLGNLKKIQQYDVVIEPNKPKKQMRIVMELFRRRHYADVHPAYDGSSILYSAKLLGDAMEDTIEAEHEGRMKEYLVKIQKVQEIDMGIVPNFYNNVMNNIPTAAPQVALQVIDVVLRHTLSLTRICAGSSFFTVHDCVINLGNGRHLYRGMFQSATLGWKPFLNVDISNRAFPSAINVIDLIREFDGLAVLDQALPNWMYSKLEKHLKMLKVDYVIPGSPASRRIYRVNGVVANARDHVFERENQMINVLNYYRSEKGYTIRYPMMPLLWVGSRNGNIRVPAELCTVFPHQVVNGACDPEQTSAMIRQCTMSTDDRKQLIENNLRNAGYNNDPVVKEFGFSVSNNLEQVEARILPPVSIKYKGGDEVPSKGVWSFRPFLISGIIRTGWTILNLNSSLKPQVVHKLVDLAKKNGRQLGLDMENYVQYRQEASRNVGRRNEAAEIENHFRQIKGKGYDLVFVILPYKAGAYKYVKTSSEIAVGCLTQCIETKTLVRINDMIMKNLLLKVNSKLNGSNHHFTSFPQIMKNSCVMVMGADVTHPIPGAVNRFSVAAVTASHDPDVFKYNMCWRLQQPGQEIIEDMENITKEQLRYFHKANNYRCVPNKIIFYRDGVSSGQFDEVLQSELQAIRRACIAMGANYKPAITFVVVQKRHHTRLFPVDRKICEDRNNNVPAGTVVDKTITMPTLQNFFLVSHASIQGVARPTKYVTLWDDNSVSDDDLQELTYYLCHMFARCVRSVSYPAPTYYAHLAAARGKAYCETTEINTDNLAREQQLLEIKDCIVNEMPMFFI